jgi:hypothetical protein
MKSKVRKSKVRKSKVRKSKVQRKSTRKSAKKSTRKFGGRPSGRGGRGRNSNYLGNTEDSRSSRYLKCPYCGAEYTSSKDLIKLGTGTLWTTRSRRLYGCYSCKKILGISSKESN